MNGRLLVCHCNNSPLAPNPGNTIAKNGTPDDPAVVIERSGVSRTKTVRLLDPFAERMLSQNNVVKRAHELNEVESEE